MSILFKPCFIKLIQNTVNQQIRFYPRWSHRTPVRVIPPEKLQKTIPDVENEEISHHKSSSIIKDKHPIIDIDELNSLTEPFNVKSTTSNKSQKKKTHTTDMLETVIDAEGNIVYKKLKNNDSRVGTLLTLAKSKKIKTKKDIVLLEGKRLIKEALINNCKLQYLIFSRSKEIEYIKSYLPKSGSTIFKMPYREMQMWSDLTTCPGIMGLFKTPDLTLYEGQNVIPLTIICDNIREPGNLGSIIRTCAAVGCDKVILTKGCVNLWDTKVTRSSAGAHFNLQIHQNQNWSDIEKLIEMHSQVFVADNKIISNDGNWAIEGKEIVNLIPTLPLVPYYGAKFHCSVPTVLIVGGETEGISLETYKFAAKRDGARLNIPLENNIDSLNTGTALGIIMFEMKKQILQNNINETDKSNAVCPQFL